MRWQVQEAKQRFSEVVRRAQEDGPQIVTKHGEDIVVVINVEEYENLQGHYNAAFLAHLRAMPEIPDEFLERPRGTSDRVIDLED